MPMKLYKYFVLVLAISAVNGQSDSARYLWNKGDYRFGDNFFRSDVSDTLFINGRQIMATDEIETTLVFPRKDLSVYDDSGGMKIYPTSSTIFWNFPKAWEVQPGGYAYATLGIAPDEIQIAMEGNSENNRGICFYSRGDINLALRFLSDQGEINLGVQVIEQFNYGLPNAFLRVPFRIWSDRSGYGYGLAKFLDLNPGYANMGNWRDSVVIINIRIDTLFGAYGQCGSGYAKFIRAQILDTTKFEIDVSGAYRIAGGSEVRPQAVATDTVMMKNIVFEGSNCAGKVYVSEGAAFRIARYIPGITAEHSCLLTLAGDNDDFINLKSFCRMDSMIIRGSSGYTGFIEYLLYKKSSRPQYQDKPSRTAPVMPTGLTVYPVITNQSVQIQYTVPNTQHVELNLYDVVGRWVDCYVNGVVEPARYSLNLDVSGLSQGLYFLRLQVGSQTSKEKVVIVK